MGTGIITTGIAGLQVAQLGLLTTEHNITNANTPGFNRQRTVQSTNIAMLSGAGYIGQGAHVSTVERMYSGFLSAQVNSAQSTSSELDAYYTQIKQIDNMLADVNAGVSPALQEFFTGVQKVAANPSQLPSRQAMISSAQALVARYQGLDDRLSEMYDGVNSQIATAVTSINSYAEQIASLNQSIVIAQSSINQPANDLLDQRDQLVSELNKLVKVTSSTNTDGSFNVYFGNGQQLVVGAQVMTMTVQAAAADSSRLVVGLKNAAGTQELPESLISGGSLGGLLSFRSGSLDRVANELGRNAASLALTFNAQNALGQDLQGNIHGDPNFVDDFFNVPTPKVIANTLNAAGSPNVSASYTAPAFNGNFYTELTGSDYRLSSDGTNLTLTRLSDNYSWTTATMGGSTDPADLTAVIAADPSGPQGFTLAASAVLSAGTSYLIEPTRDAARNLSVNAVVAADPRLVAAAAPIRTQAGTGNTGSAIVSAGSVATGYSAASGLPATFTYAAGVPPQLSATVDVTVTSGGVSTTYLAGASWNYVSGDNIVFNNGISFNISGTPGNNDSFVVARNSAGISDGRNALALGGLQTQNTMTGKTASFQSAYAQLVSDSGNKSRELAVKSEAQSALLKQSEAARDSLSGVNLDEEAANLLRYQQAYQASAKMLDVGNKLFDSLLSIMA